MTTTEASDNQEDCRTKLVRGFRGDHNSRARGEGIMHRSSPVTTDDDQTIDLATRGDREAFGQLYERYSVRVFRHAYFLTGDLSLAEDLTAQTFLKALEAISRYQLRGLPFVAWLFRITCNLSINYKKAHKNNGHTQLPETLEPEG